MIACRLSLVFPVMAAWMVLSNVAFIFQLFELNNEEASSNNNNNNVMLAVEQKHTKNHTESSHDIQNVNMTAPKELRLRAQTSGSLGVNGGARRQDKQQPKLNASKQQDRDYDKNLTLSDIHHGSRASNVQSPNAIDTSRPNDTTMTQQQQQARQESNLHFPSLSPFPYFASLEFNKTCSWILPRLDSHSYDNCTLVAKLYEEGSEGVSDWASKVVEAHHLATQLNCRLFLKYGVHGVDINKVFLPVNEHWTIPQDYTCNKDPSCIEPFAQFHFNWRNYTLFKKIDKQVARVPYYRMAYAQDGPLQHLYKDSNQELRNKLPGFDLETGMACSMQSLLKLAPTASMYEPRLYTHLLPTLHDDDETLVICLYIRTGRTDARARGESLEADARNRYKQRAESAITCAQHLEQEHLYNSTMTYKRSVWLVITDAPFLKEYISQSHSTVNRTILTTSSRGIHSRPKGRPSMQQVAEALIDWYLIGESSLVVTKGSVSFGETAALRTSRPLYAAGKCKRIELIHTRQNKKATL